RKSATDGLEEGSVSVSAFRLGSRISTGGRWRRGGEPEPNEESKRLRSDSQVTLKTFGLAGKENQGARGGSPPTRRPRRSGERNEATADSMTTDLVSF